ncbi:MAG: endonuclease domain-containing protein [Rhizomicrobium sp.]
MKWADGLRRRDLKQSAAKQLRSAMTDAERKLWAVLHKKGMDGIRFRRQQPVGPYIADFYCAQAKLVVELDGGQHSEQANLGHDEVHTRFLSEQGCRVLRFTNLEFFEHRDVVLEGIWRALGDRPLPEPPPAARPSREGRVD